MNGHTKTPIIVTGIATGEIDGFSSQPPLRLDNTIKRWTNPPALIKDILESECLALNS